MPTDTDIDCHIRARHSTAPITGSRSDVAGVARSRWAAIGAAVAVALGAGGMLTASAVDSAPTTYVATTPCRVVDTRPAPDNVGPRSTPLGARETFSTPFVGAVGKCNIPANAVAVEEPDAHVPGSVGGLGKPRRGRNHRQL
jgi:hypothetical protein